MLNVAVFRVPCVQALHNIKACYDFFREGKSKGDEGRARWRGKGRREKDYGKGRGKGKEEPAEWDLYHAATLVHLDHPEDQKVATAVPEALR